MGARAYAGYSRENAKKQRMTVVAPKPQPMEREHSWWTHSPREGFTKRAERELQPEKAPTVYKYPSCQD